MRTRAIITASPEETERLGAALAEDIVRRPRRRAATVVALSGDLGAGKTTFVRGLLRFLGVRRAASPTFILMRRHRIRQGFFRHVFHMDAYRLRRTAELTPLRFKEMLADPSHLVLIEWAPNIRRALPRDSVSVRFAHGRTENERRITYS